MVYTFREYHKSQLLTGHLRMGGQNPAGERIDVTSQYFTRGNKPWIGVLVSGAVQDEGRGDFSCINVSILDLS